MNIIPLDELYELEEFHYKAMEDTAKQEKDNDITLIKEQTTLQSTQRSIQASGGIPKYSSSLPEKTEINSLSQEKTLSELIAEKGYHVQYLGWDHIGYLFSIEQDGRIFYSEKTGYKQYHCKGQNNKCFGICIIGDGSIASISKEQADSLEKIIKAYKSSEIRLHRDFSNKSCPGDYLLKSLQAQFPQLIKRY